MTWTPCRDKTCPCYGHLDRTLSLAAASERIFSCPPVDLDTHSIAGYDCTLIPKEARRIKRRLDWFLLPLMCMLYLLRYVDVGTLEQSASIGLTQAAHLSGGQLDSVVSIFFIGYLAFQFPQAFVLHKLHIGKWLSINVFIWSVVLSVHAACKSFGALLAVRFILGTSQGVVSTGFMTLSASFYTSQEQPELIGYWLSMSGIAVGFLEILAFGVARIQSTLLQPWQWLMILPTIVTFVTSVLLWLLFPDSLADARFLTCRDRRLAMIRIKGCSMGDKNRGFKKSQLKEVLSERETWLFALLALATQIPVVFLLNVKQSVVGQFNRNPFQTLLINSLDGLIGVSIISAVKFVACVSVERAYAGALWTFPAILGGILASVLPHSDRVGLLVAYWMSLCSVACFPLMLGWMGSVTVGHTKRVLLSAIVQTTYALGNVVGPYVWEATDRRSTWIRLPWVVITACELAVAVLFLVTQLLLSDSSRQHGQVSKGEREDRIFDVDAKDIQSEMSADKVHPSSFSPQI